MIPDFARCQMNCSTQAAVAHGCRSIRLVHARLPRGHSRRYIRTYLQAGVRSPNVCLLFGNVKEIHSTQPTRKSIKRIYSKHCCTCRTANQAQLHLLIMSTFSLRIQNSSIRLPCSTEYTFRVAQAIQTEHPAHPAQKPPRSSPDSSGADNVFWSSLLRGSKPQ